MAKKRLYLVQVNGRYGDQAPLPYSVGLLWAYARTFPAVTDAYEFCGFLYLKEPWEKAAAKLDAPDLVAFSSYIWNWQWNKGMAQWIKKRWPNCVTLTGGVHVWDESQKTLEENPEFDFAIYGEGEGAFVDFLIEHAKAKPNYAKCGSLVWWDYEACPGEGVLKDNPRRSFVDLEELRSPYLDGVFDDILPLEKKWVGCQETNRGCGFACAFCAWGASSLSKLRLFPSDRVFGELQWFGGHGITYLENADANFGIVKRDVEFSKRLVETKQRYGYPERFRAAFAKNSNETIWEIANTLHRADMLKSVTLAMQSMNDQVLINIQRKNIKFDKFAELIQRYEDAGIPTYTELILGLAGESLSMFVDGVERNLQAGQHSGIFVYNNLMLPNTEQADPKYIERFGLKTCNMQAMLIHGTPEPGVVPERQLTVIETAAMPHEDWRQGWLFARTIECFHCLGLLQHIARKCWELRQIQYRLFYLILMEWLKANPSTVAGTWFANIQELLNGALSGGSWNCIDSRFGPVSWPPEEFMFLNILLYKDRFYGEILDFLIRDIGGGTPFPLLQEQRAMVAGPEPGNEAEWAKHAVWWGRKGDGRKMRENKGVSPS